MELKSYDASSVLDINKISRFPFNLFCTPADTIFFTTVLKNLYDVSILTITKLVTDKSGDLSTLLQFKNQVVKSIKPEYKDALTELLKKVRFENNINDMLDIATNIRNSRIAHLKIDTIFNDQIKRLKIDELEELARLLNSLLQALSFNVEQLMIPIPYSQYARQNTDLEKILDTIALNSKLLILPETIPIDAWERHKKKMAQVDIDNLNKYRGKFNLPEV